MNKKQHEELKAGIVDLEKYLLGKYPDDTVIKPKLDELKRILGEQKEKEKTPHENKKATLRKKMELSYSEDNSEDNINVLYNHFHNNEDKMIDALIKLNNEEEKEKKKGLKFAYKQGMIINRLKEFLKLEKAFLREYLNRKGIVYSTSHLYALMKFSEIARKHPKLLNCAISLRDVTRNLELVETICVELGW